MIASKRRRYVQQIWAIVPANLPQTRANARPITRIVIPVVVGSSPISHPKNRNEINALFMLSLHGCWFEQWFVPAEFPPR